MTSIGLTGQPPDWLGCAGQELLADPVSIKLESKDQVCTGTRPDIETFSPPCFSVCSVITDPSVFGAMSMSVKKSANKALPLIPVDPNLPENKHRSNNFTPYST